MLASPYRPREIRRSPSLPAARVTALRAWGELLPLGRSALPITQTSVCLVPSAVGKQRRKSEDFPIPGRRVATFKFCQPDQRCFSAGKYRNPFTSSRKCDSARSRHSVLTLLAQITHTTPKR